MDDTPPGDSSDPSSGVDIYQSGHQQEGKRLDAYAATPLNGASPDLPQEGLVLLTVWASWCTICKGDEPVWDELARDYDNLTVYAVSRESSQGPAQDHIDRKEFAYGAFWDKGVNGALGMRDYQPNHMLILDGEVVSVYEGSLRQRPGGEAGLRADIETLLG